ncbi:hypothetical protein CAAN1_01S00914 [[Candida] anglica]|uniref:Uncharacterized protein n=1 Tax=[Candida] anglica TaxID=148631 RepID=A0ABP0EN87_9ASCO
MRAISQSSWTLGADQWALNLSLLGNSNFACSSSSGSINVYALNNNSPTLSFKAHESSINSMKSIDSNTLVSCSTDGVKLWDLRTSCSSASHTLSNEKSSNFLSVNFSETMIAGGTELQGVDAELHLWDLRNPGAGVVRSFVDSHHDDITDIKFHPTLSQYLMSGSTDGYVNVYDLNQADEEDALHQVINYASVHSCHFTQERRIAVLSHMETVAFYELNNTNYEEIEEPAPNDLGDVRSTWPDCEYIVDIYPGFVAYGANTQQKLSLYPFDSAKEKVDLTRPVWFPNAHGEEVVRDVLAIPGTKSVLTCGEDGNIRSWELPYQLDFDSFYKIGDQAETSDIDIELESEVESKSEKKEKKDKKEKKEKREKKDKKEKKEKKDKKEKKEKKDKKDKKDKKEKKKSKSDVRFKPY